MTNADAVFREINSFVSSNRERIEGKRQEWLRLLPAQRRAELAVLYRELEDFCCDIKALLEEAAR